MPNSKKIFPVQIDPDGIHLVYDDDKTLIECAWRHGYYWPTICGGVGECGACRCEIVAGEENIGPLTAAEEIFFRTNPRMRQSSPAMRLACCLALDGPVTVRKKGVKKR